LFGVFCYQTTCRGAKSGRKSAHPHGIIPIFPFANPSITAMDNSIVPFPSSVYMSTCPPMLAFAFDSVQAVVFLFVGLGSPMPLPDFHDIERSGNKPATNPDALKALG
jgi:hypothetical protein